jgi:hypothetical protein
MKIKIIENCFISGKPHRKGDILEVGDLAARDLINMERAVPVVREESKLQEAKPEPKAKPDKGGK